MKILCPIDFSKESMHALSFMSQLINKFESEVYLLYVRETQTKEVPKELKEKMNQVVAGLDASVTKNKMIHANFEQGQAAKQIMAHAKDKDIDLIVMGTQGMSSYDNIFFGSVAENVIEKSNIPVIVVPKSAALNNAPEKMGIAVDNRLIDNEAIFEYPNLFAKNFNTKIDIIHIDTTRDSDLPFDPFILNYLGDNAGEFHVLKDKIPSFAINALIDTKDIDILIMIRREHSFLKELFGINYTKEQMNIINIPLMIIPEQVNL